MSKVWESISELEETPWSTAVPRKIRKSLDAVQEGMRNLPNRVRQYEPFEHAQVMYEARARVQDDGSKLWLLTQRLPRSVVRVWDSRFAAIGCRPKQLVFLHRTR